MFSLLGLLPGLSSVPGGVPGGIGIVDYAAPTDGDVFPWHFAKSFRRSQTYRVYSNRYANGEVQVRPAVNLSRRTWELQESLTAAQLEELRSYYEEHDGSIVPFYFYDVNETTNFAYDVTGVSVIGRYITRFDCDYSADMGVGSLRGSVGIRLIEVV